MNDPLTVDRRAGHMVAMFETLARVMMAPADELRIACEICGHEAVLSRHEAFTRFGGDASPFMVRRRSACGACGERKRLAVRIG